MLLQHEQRAILAQRIDPKLIMASAFLQLNSMELLQTIENELLDNPALDTLDDAPCAGDCIDPASCPYCSAQLPTAAKSDNDTEAPDWEDYERDEPFSSPLVGESDDEFDVIGSLEAELTLQDHLRSLLRAAVSSDDYAIGEYLISCLDERGWLDGSVESIARDLGVDESDVCRLLTVIQSFDPPGVGARTLQECLQLQLQFLREDNADSKDLRIIRVAERIVTDYFEHVGARRYAKLARAVGVPSEAIKAALEFIRTRLNPFPASAFRAPWQFRPANTRTTIRPDVIIRRAALGYEVEIAGSEMANLCVNANYRDAYSAIKEGQSAHTPNDRKHFVEHVERAELFLRILRQRRDTLRQITKGIIECQTGFLETGSRQFLRPLTRTSVARKLDVHESTVSRATANKFVQLPNQEVVSFNIFFNGTLSVKDAIDSLIQDEDPANPLSDIQIVERLKERGIEVARRTIVKYREQEKILSSTHRRR